MPFNLGQYLARIGLAAPPSGLDGLNALQAAHLSTIPFENIDPLLGQVPSLDPADVIDKLITRRRGGYCFEHNALFGMALAALGYAPRPILARVRNGAPEGGARTHQAFAVDLAGTSWLADTGFGGHGTLRPIALIPGREQAAPNGTYRVMLDPSTGETVLERRAGREWLSLYGFVNEPVRAVDIEAANFLCARWEGAPFSANLMLALHRPAGRIALFNRAVTLGLPPDTETTVLSGESELANLLKGAFGLGLTQVQIQGVWEKIKDAPTHR